MFKELAEITKTTGLSIFVTATTNDLLKVQVIPIPVAGANPALSQAFVLEGTPDELDNELSGYLAGYVTERKSMAETLADLKVYNDGVIKAAQEAATKAATDVQKVAPAPTSAPVVTVDHGAADDGEDEQEIELF